MQKTSNILPNLVTLAGTELTVTEVPISVN